MPRTAIFYARSNRRENLDRQVRELEDWYRANVASRQLAAPHPSTAQGPANLFTPPFLRSHDATRAEFASRTSRL
jgi:hypothetical protein